MEIQKVGMTRNHYEPGEPGRVRMVVIHATAGSYPGDYHWLRKGGDPNRPVSIHYYITKNGMIYQMVPDQHVAWHCGKSAWVVDGKRITNCNPVALGIELENRNTGADPYPAAQYAAALWLTRRLVVQYHVPRNQLVRHLDIAPGRKTDPAGFPWERFVAEVYAEVVDLPAPSEQLRRRLVERAFAAAGGSVPAQWPLFDAALSQGLGMPVAAIAGRDLLGDPDDPPPGPTAQDDLDQPLLIGGRSYVLEAYARDLLYLASDQPAAAVQRLSDTPSGPLRDGLLHALFAAVDPVNAFRPAWMMHRYWLEHAVDLGSPISANYRLPVNPGGAPGYACQHFALDTLCSPVGAWETVFRLSDLVRAFLLNAGAPPPGAPPEILRRLMEILLYDLYLSKTRRLFDRDALLCRYALTESLGAPLGPAMIEQVGNERILVMPFALDVIYCRVPASGWTPDLPLSEATEVGSLVSLLRAVPAAESTLGRLGRLLGLLRPAAPGDERPAPSWRSGGRLLGRLDPTPLLNDLSLHLIGGEERLAGPPDRVVVYPVAGPAHRDLAAAARPYGTLWNYYIDLHGRIIRLLDEDYAPRAAHTTRWSGKADLDQRSVAVAVEGGRAAMDRSQGTALRWLLRDLMLRRHFAPGQVLATSDWNQ